MNRFSFPLLMLLLLVPGLLYAQSSSSSSSSPAFDFTVQMGQGCFTTIAHRSVNGAGAVDSECDPKSYQPHAFSGAL